MKRDLEPIDPELRSLLDAEADFPPEEVASADRVWNGVRAALAIPPGGGEGGSAPETPSTPAAPTSNLSTTATIAALAFLAGGITGAVLHSRWSEPKVVMVPAATVTSRSEVEAPPAPPPPAPVSATAPPPPIASAKLAVAPAQPSASAKAPTPRTTDLARERAIIEVARTAVARGRISAALEAIDRHAREFPKGQLVEEREGLRVLALARSGRSDDARARAEAFRKKYPKSVLLPATEAATEQKEEP